MNDQPATPPTKADWIAVLVALVLPTAITWVYFFGADDASTGAQLAVYNVVKVVQFVFPIAWVVGYQRRWPRVRPLRTQGIGLGLAFGAAVAAAIWALYFGVLKGSPIVAEALPAIRDKVADFGIDRTWKFVALGVFYSVFHALLEEYYWRWFVFGQLARLTTFPTALLVSSLGFMAHHVLVLGKFFGFDNPATYLFSASVAVGGAFWAWLYHRTGSLVGPWLSHLLVDAAIHVVGYDLIRDMLH